MPSKSAHWSDGLPSAIRVGALDYRVAIKPRGSGDDSLGSTDKRAQIIQFDRDQDPLNAAVTLIHELLHACWERGDLEDREKEEKAVCVLSNQLTQVLRDNPKLRAWLEAVWA